LIEEEDKNFDVIKFEINTAEYMPSFKQFNGKIEQDEYETYPDKPYKI
jgi:hypothetical protein